MNVIERTLSMDLDLFKKIVFEMPTNWLTNWYVQISTENDRLHAMIDAMIDDTAPMVHQNAGLIDNQIDCFNKMIAVANVLTYRDVPVPVGIMIVTEE